jgi:hypothetical protein
MGGLGGSRGLFPYGKFAKEYANHEAPVKKPPKFSSKRREAPIIRYKTLSYLGAGWFWLPANKLILLASGVWLLANKLILPARKLILFAKKPVFLPGFFGILKNYRRFRASIKALWGLFLSALPILRLIVQTTTAGTAGGCPQTPHKGDVL